MAGYRAYPEYKDSGVKWLGMVPKHWDVMRIKNVATYNDEVLGEHTESDYEIEYVDISSVNLVEGITSTETISFDKAPSRARRKVKDGDTIISTVRTYLKAIAAIKSPPENLIVSTGFAVIRPKPEIYPGYLGYLLRSGGVVGDVVANSVGVSYPAINASVLAALPVVQPPIDEQRAITNYLDHKMAQIDALIAKKEALLDKLSEKRTALISHAVTKGLDPKAKMKDSSAEWLGMVPQNWEMTKVKYIGDLILGLTYSPNDVANEDGVLVLRSSNVQDGEIDLEDCVYVTCEVPKKLITKKDDILICSRNGSRALIGKCALIDEMAAGQTFGAFMTVLRTKHAEFLYYILNSSLFKFQSGRFLTSTINQLTTQTLGGFEIALPPCKEQKEIVNYLKHETSAIDEQYQKVQEVVDRLIEYRSALITQAVTGKIDVRNIEISEGAEKGQAA